MSKKAKGLGKGLSALIPDNTNTNDIPTTETIIESGIKELALTDILPNPSQPRKNFAEEALEELAQSIKEHGVIQPLVVRELPSGKYEIVAGERRWRASKKAGLQNLPVIIKKLTDQEVMQIAIIENIQREDLNPIEEAEAFSLLMQEHKMTQEVMAQKVGKSRSYIANSLRLLGLHKIIRGLVADGKLSAGHARALITLTHDEQLRLAEIILAHNLSVRETENLINKREKPKPLATSRKIDPDLKAFESNLRSRLGTKVKLKHSEKGGIIEIQYYSDEDLLRLSDLLLQIKD